MPSGPAPTAGTRSPHEIQVPLILRVVSNEAPVVKSLRQLQRRAVEGNRKHRARLGCAGRVRRKQIFDEIGPGVRYVTVSGRCPPCHARVDKDDDQGLFAIDDRRLDRFAADTCAKANRNAWIRGCGLVDGSLLRAGRVAGRAGPHGVGLSRLRRNGRGAPALHLSVAADGPELRADHRAAPDLGRHQLRRRAGTSPPVDRRQAARDRRARIAELEDFSSQLEIVEAALQASAPPAACRTDLSCCVPETNTAPVLVELGAKRPHAVAAPRHCRR